jgi:hypothetical protein
LKKVFKAFAFALWLALAYLASSASADFPPLRVSELDGSPDVKGVYHLKFPNGSLTNAGGIVTVDFVGAGFVSGSGTQTKIPKWSDSMILGDSLISDNGSVVTVNGGQTIAGRLSVGGGAFPTNSYIDASFTDSTPAGAMSVINANVSRSSDPGGTPTTAFNCSLNYAGTVDAPTSTFRGLLLQPWNLSGHSLDKLIGARVRILNIGTTAQTVLFQGALDSNFSGSTITLLKGLDLSGWVNAGTVTTSYGIYMDSSIDVGATKYAFYSLSTSPSLFSGNVNFTKTITATATTASQISSNQNDYNPGGQSYFQRWSSDASRNVTGLTFTTAHVDGEVHNICNVGAQNIVLKHDDGATSTAANRFKLKSATDRTIAADECVLVTYDATTARWRAN